MTLAEGEERVPERSDGRVSQIATTHIKILNNTNP